MSYRIYSTKSFIISPYNRNESDRLYCLYSQQLGTLFARARNARSESSKLRSVLSGDSLLEVELIRGRADWKIIGASEIESTTLAVWSSAAFARILRLVRRLAPYEYGENPQLFKVLEEVRDFFTKAPVYRKKEQDFIEIVAVAKVLKALGYWSDEDPVSLTMSRADLHDMMTQFRDMRAQVHSALYDSMM